MVQIIHFHTQREKGNLKMATTKQFKVIGVSTFKGKRKVRFAQGLERVKALIKAGNSDVELFELPEPMTKEAGIEYARANNLFVVPGDADVTAEDVVSAVAGE